MFFLARCERSLPVLAGTAVQPAAHRTLSAEEMTVHILAAQSAEFCRLQEAATQAPVEGPRVEAPGYGGHPGVVRGLVKLGGLSKGFLCCDCVLAVLACWVGRARPAAELQNTHIHLDSAAGDLAPAPAAGAGAGKW